MQYTMASDYTPENLFYFGILSWLAARITTGRTTTRNRFDDKQELFKSDSLMCCCVAIGFVQPFPFFRWSEFPKQ